MKVGKKLIKNGEGILQKFFIQNQKKKGTLKTYLIKTGYMRDHLVFMMLMEIIK